jgi:hypothetical protein
MLQAANEKINNFIGFLKKSTNIASNCNIFVFDQTEKEGT